MVQRELGIGEGEVRRGGRHVWEGEKLSSFLTVSVKL